MPDVITVLENNRVITEVAGADVLLPMAIAASAENADRAEQAYQDILEVASGAPDAPSILNKLNKSGDNADPDFLENIGAATAADIAGKLDTDGDNSAPDILTNLPYTQSAAGAVTRTQQDKNDDFLNAADFGLVGDSDDDILALQNALANAIQTGRTLYIPPGNYRAAGLNAIINTYLPFAPALGGGLRIEGAGECITNLDNREENGFLFDLSTDTAYKFAIGGFIRGLSITNGAAVANSSGIQARSCWTFTLENLLIEGLSGSGIRWACDAGDADGNVWVSTRNVRIQDCKVWGWDGAAGATHNENSYLSTFNVAIQGCGVGEESAITGISKANPAVVTSAGHGRVDGDLVYIAGVQGMTAVNTAVSQNAYVVAGVTANTFQLTGVNSTGFGTYTTGGHVVSARPKSGGMRWKGQISPHANLGLSLNENVGLYVEPGPATAQGLDLSGVVIENPKMCGAIIGGVASLRSSMGQSYAYAAQAGKQCYFGWMLDGTTDAVQHVYIDKHTVRINADTPDYAQWAMCGSYVDTQTVKITNTYWKEFGYSRQARFTAGFRFDVSRPDGIEAVVQDASTAWLQPNATAARSGLVPIRMRYTDAGTVSDGEWVMRRIELLSIPKPGSDGTYCVYVYDNGVTAVEVSTTGPALDYPSGLMVKAGDATRTYIGRLAVSGGSWVTTSGGWINPERIEVNSPGTKGSLFFSAVDRRLKVKTAATLPSSVGDADHEFWSSAEFFHNEAVVVPAGAGAVFATTITAPGVNVGAYIDDLSTNYGMSNFGYTAACNTGGTIDVQIFDPTQVGGSLNGGASVRLQCKVSRR